MILFKFIKLLIYIIIIKTSMIKEKSAQIPDEVLQDPSNQLVLPETSASV
jgi:hypothetical protein